MKFEDLQNTWQNQGGGNEIRINSDLLLTEVRRNHQASQTTVLWRDVLEVGVAVIMAAFFLNHGIRRHDWTLYLLALGCIWVGGFMVVDRLLQRRKQPNAKETLKSCAEASLAQVTHQIWLLKNVAWWYLLPITLPLGITLLRSVLEASPSRLVFCGGYAAICALLFWGVYHLNQFAIRKNLEPRRQELKSLLAGLEP